MGKLEEYYTQFTSSRNVVMLHICSTKVASHRRKVASESGVKSPTFVRSCFLLLISCPSLLISFLLMEQSCFEIRVCYLIRVS